MFDTFKNRLTVEGWLETRTALRVGSGRATKVAGTDLPVMRDALDRPFIPGSSFKGALRARIESLIRSVVEGRHGACIPTGQDADRCLPASDVRDGDQVLVEGMSALRDMNPDDAQMAQEVWQRSCLVCRTFGSPWLASHVQVRDLPVDEARWFGLFQVRNGVAIDRDTETASAGLLYDYEVVPAGTRFECRIVAENLEPWQLGMLWLGLQPFVGGQAAVGGFRSRGLGQVSFAERDPKLYYFSLNGDDTDPVDQLIDYLQQKAQRGKEVAPAQIKDELGWIQAFKEALRDAQRRTQA
jgi:CRISPR-associated RAMP protein (TIGR02581 family)